MGFQPLQHTRLSRRSMMKNSGLAAAGAFSLAASNNAFSMGKKEPALTSATAFSLRDIAASRGLVFGSAVTLRQLKEDPAYAALVARECLLIVPENSMKFLPLTKKGRGNYDFYRPDQLLRFADQSNQQLRGHTLVWHKSLPEWFAAEANTENAKDIMVQHIEAVAGRYKGKLHSWDVLNEVVKPVHGRPDGLRNTPWMELLGEDHIALAFNTAKRVDPNTPLYYSEFGVEMNTPEHQARREVLLRLLKQWRQDGLPVDGLTIHGHTNASQAADFSPSVFTNFLNQVGKLGYTVMVSEVDVSDRGIMGDYAARDNAVAAMYEAYITAALASPAVNGVLTWGLTDKYTYHRQFKQRQDGQKPRPLLYDGNLQPKASRAAVARALRSRAL